MSTKLELHPGAKIELYTGHEGVVEKIDLTETAWVRLDNGDLFRYTLDGKNKVGGGECGNASMYDFYDGSMNIRRLIPDELTTTRNALDILERRFAFLQDEAAGMIRTIEGFGRLVEENAGAVADRDRLEEELTRANTNLSIRIQRNVILEKERDILQGEKDAMEAELMKSIVDGAKVMMGNTELAEILQSIVTAYDETTASIQQRPGYTDPPRFAKAREILARHAAPESDPFPLADMNMAYEEGRMAGRMEAEADNWNCVVCGKPARVLKGHSGICQDCYTPEPLPDPFAGLPGYEPKQPIFDNEEEGSDALRLRRANETKDEMISRRLDNLLKP